MDTMAEAHRKDSVAERAFIDAARAIEAALEHSRLSPSLRESLADNSKELRKIAAHIVAVWD